MKVVVGLGNPGQKYVGTRHNVGFDVLRILAEKYQAEPSRTKFESGLTEVVLGNERVLLVAPQTFMNLSGRAVRQVMDFYKLETSDLLLVCDDLNLENGRLRLRASGTAGGQKGLQNTIDHLGTQDFARLRIGIGRPPGRMDAAAYVLQRFSASDRESMAVTVQQAADAVVQWVQQGIQSTMNSVNAAPAPKTRGTSSIGKAEESNDPGNPQ
ncbi:MAG: aminoacyl-tRNA hydrolase [Planctomycetaceae bacterium]|nr:aminoacyl-tRNA hydrolase [Planctomycetaceae bacterium]